MILCTGEEKRREEKRCDVYSCGNDTDVAFYVVFGGWIVVLACATGSIQL